LKNAVGFENLVKATPYSYITGDFEAATETVAFLMPMMTKIYTDIKKSIDLYIQC